MRTARFFGVMIALTLMGAVLGAATFGGAFAAPTSVAVVNVPKVMDKLHLRAQLESELAVMTESMKEEDASRQEHLDALQTQLREVPAANADERELKREELALALLEYKAWLAFASEQLDIDKAIRYRSMDRSIRQAVAELAEANGYDIVLMDDSSQELGANPESKVPREFQVRQQMTSRRVLFARPAADLTDELIQRMNNAFNAG